MRHVVVLRPEPGASATVKRARELGLEPVTVPLFEIEPLPWQSPVSWPALPSGGLCSISSTRFGTS